MKLAHLAFSIGILSSALASGHGTISGVEGYRIYSDIVAIGAQPVPKKERGEPIYLEVKANHLLCIQSGSSQAPTSTCELFDDNGSVGETFKRKVDSGDGTRRAAQNLFETLESLEIGDKKSANFIFLKSITCVRDEQKVEQRPLQPHVKPTLTASCDVEEN